MSINAQVRPQTMHELFERAALEHADRPAIEIPPDGGRATRTTVTYRELAADAQRLQHSIERFVHEEAIVAVLLPRESPHVLAAQIAVLRAGGAFVTPDLKLPEAQLRFVLEDANAVAVLTDAAGSQRLAGVLPPERVIDVAKPPAGHVGVEAQPVDKNRLAYVIYTSGTSGKPKGVLIEHDGVVDLATQTAEYFNVRPGDRISQFSSHAFDASIEECWVALATGATLVVGDDDVVRSGPDLIPWLQRERITILIPTPTILRSTGCPNPAATLPDLRIVYVGGEALPQELNDAWADGIWLENGYGPTECTVTTTRATMRKGEPVTIGDAIPGRIAHILDHDLQPVADGQRGELCMAGAGLARGYLGREALTAERFPEHPTLGRIYRTGDAVTRGPDKMLTCHGRIDNQVKVRGHRIELEAIESTLNQFPEIRQAACTVQGRAAAEDLVAFLVAEGAARLSDAELTERLREALPVYMVPAHFGWLEQLPTTVGGKLARNQLPEFEAAQPILGDARPPSTPLEARIVSAMAAVLELETVCVDGDFFDHGGTSLRAAEMISALRDHADTAALTVRDLYDHRTAAALAHHLASNAEDAPTTRRPKALPRGGRPLLITCLQTAWLIGALLVGAPIAYFATFGILPGLVDSVGFIPLLLIGGVASWLVRFAYAPLAVVVAVMAKKLLIGRYEAGVYPVWSSFYLRHWIVERITQMVPWNLFAGTVWQSSILRALGARVGERVHIHRGVDLLRGGWDLLEIGDDVTLAQDSAVGLVHLEGGCLVVDRVRLEDGCTLAVRAGVAGDTVVGSNAYLEPLASLPGGERIPAGERWDGIPARSAGPAPTPPAVDRSREISPHRHAIRMLATRFAVELAIWLPFALLSWGLIVGLGLSDAQLLDALFTPLEQPVLAAGVVILAALQLAAGVFWQACLVRWLPKTPAGSMSRFDPHYVYAWLRTDLLNSSSNWLAGSLMWMPWLRIAGMRIGHNSEVSTIIDVLPEHISIGAECFFADGIYLGGPIVHRGTVTVHPTRFGDNTFFGNHVVVPPGSALPADILLGVCTVAHESEIRPGTSWFGHPPFELPRREIVTADRSLTHDPGPLRRAHRWMWELMRFTLPSVTLVVTLCWFASVSALATTLSGWSLWVFGTAAVTLGAGAVLATLVLALKWCLLGRVRPGQHGLWSAWCCRWDFLYVAWDRIAHRVIAQLSGTLLLGFYLRGIGVRVGRRVVLGHGFAHIVDPDMLTFEDDATVDAHFQAHSFEDRVLKIDKVRLGARSSVRRGTVLMYGANIGADTVVAPHSVVMKNEVLLPERIYEGCPTR